MQGKVRIPRQTPIGKKIASQVWVSRSTSRLVLDNGSPTQVRYIFADFSLGA